MKRAFVILLVIVIGLPMIAYGVGLFIPRDHVASMTIDFEKASMAQVWTLVTDFGNTPKWRSDVSGVRINAQADGKTRFTESTSQGDVEFEVLEQSPGKQVVKVVDDGQPFGGTWTWLVAPRPGGGTTVRITEVGFIKNPIFRTKGIIFFSPTETLDGYLRNLAKALGENAEPKITG